MSPWHAAPSPLASPRGEVHVWRARLDVGDTKYASFASLLSDGERTRADAYRFERDRRSFTVSCGVTRSVLASYLRTVPTAIRFRRGAHGKPALVHATEKLHFNTSRRGEVALVAVSDREIGVDVERVRDDVDALEIAERAFSRQENEALRALPPSRVRAAFFACWARKEAYVKATGLGLTLPLDGFTVSLASEAFPALLEVESNPREAAEWTIHAFDAGPDYPCALAFRGLGVAVSLFDF